MLLHALKCHVIVRVVSFGQRYMLLWLASYIKILSNLLQGLLMTIILLAFKFLFILRIVLLIVFLFLLILLSILILVFVSFLLILLLLFLCILPLVFVLFRDRLILFRHNFNIGFFNVFDVLDISLYIEIWHALCIVLGLRHVK